MRAIWNGALAFGLINIPIRIYSASKDRALKFRLLHKKDHGPIGYEKVCRTDGKTVDYKDIVKGYEYEKGEYVILDEKDFEKASPKKTKVVEIEEFVDENEIQSKLVDKPYFIEPDPKAEKAYVLLREALHAAGKVGIGKIVFKDKEQLVMVKPEDKALLLVTLRFQNELRSPDELDIPDDAKFSKKELDMALMLIGQLEDHFDSRDFKDTYTEELKKVIEKKAKGKPIRVKEEPIPTYTEMQDLMSTLKKSLEKAKSHR